MQDSETAVSKNTGLLTEAQEQNLEARSWSEGEECKPQFREQAERQGWMMVRFSFRREHKENRLTRQLRKQAERGGQNVKIHFVSKSDIKKYMMYRK